MWTIPQFGSLAPWTLVTVSYRLLLTRHVSGPSMLAKWLVAWLAQASSATSGPISTWMGGHQNVDCMVHPTHLSMDGDVKRWSHWLSPIKFGDIDVKTSHFISFHFNIMKINPDNTKTMEITFTSTHHDVPLLCTWVARLWSEWQLTFKLLGVIVSSDLTWGAQSDNLHKSALTGYTCCLCSSGRAFQSVTFLKELPVTHSTSVGVHTPGVASLVDQGSEWQAQVNTAPRTMHFLPRLVIYKSAHGIWSPPIVPGQGEHLCRDFFRDMLSPNLQATLPAAGSTRCHTASIVMPLPKNMLGATTSIKHWWFTD